MQCVLHHVTKEGKQREEDVIRTPPHTAGCSCRTLCKWTFSVEGRKCWSSGDALWKPVSQVYWNKLIWSWIVTFPLLFKARLCDVKKNHLLQMNSWIVRNKKHLSSVQHTQGYNQEFMVANVSNLDTFCFITDMTELVHWLYDSNFLVLLLCYISVFGINVASFISGKVPYSSFASDVMSLVYQSVGWIKIVAWWWRQMESWRITR